jgi:hydrogenase-4 component F
MRLATLLVLLGYGTKAGLVPMHSWLPDAHSQAPAPISALMSGVLVSVAFYAILRMKSIADVALGPGFCRALLVIAGLASLVLAASLLISQHELKRLFAYSSIEHMGLVALGAAAGGSIGQAALLLHLIGHGLAKSVCFLSAGEIIASEHTGEIGEIRALLTRRPALGGIFALGTAALLGLPPFSLFLSELDMSRAEFQRGLGWAALVALVVLVVVFSLLVGHLGRMLLGTTELDATPPERLAAGVALPLGTALGALALLGTLSWPLSPLVHAAAAVIR